MQPAERAACAGVGTGPTLYVDAASIATTPDGTTANPYKTIQAAVNAAVTNTTIKVKAGQYNESVTINKSNLALWGMAPGAAAVVNASGSHAIEIAGSANPGNVFNNGTDIFAVGGVTGTCTSCVHADPMFKDAANGDFHLLPASPAIDAGTMDIHTANNIKAPKQDFDFQVRPQDSNGDGVAKVDIGADELVAVGPPPNTPKVKLVPRGQPNHDLSTNPLVIPHVGDIVEVDLLVELPAGESIYAGEFHLVGNDPNDVIRLVDANIEVPGQQAQLRGDGLALRSLEPLRTAVVGFPDDGAHLRDCTAAPPSSGDGNDSMYTFACIPLLKARRGTSRRCPSSS